MQLGIISEITHDPRICMEYGSFTTYRDIILSNIRFGGGTELDVNKKPLSEHLSISQLSTASSPVRSSSAAAPSPSAPVPSVSPVGSASVSGGSDAPDGGSSAPSPSSSSSGYINLLHLEGPMTRSGAGCSYGSRDLRDIMLAASEDKECHGHIILANTPGGMAACLPDYRMAIDACHAAGQKVYMLIDGYAASCGAFLGAMCDGIYFTNSNDEIGSIGLYYSLLTLANGTENKVSGEVYHEIYASDSYSKNRLSRLAADGKDEELRKEADKDLAALIADLKADRPSILDEQMHGDMYTCSEVIGSLVDGQATIESLAADLISDYADRAGAPITHPVPAASPAGSDGGDTSPSSSINSQPSTHTSMKQYPSISAALQMDGAIMESDAENMLTLQQVEADALEASVAQSNARIAALVEQLDAANKAKDEALAAAAASADELVKANEALAAANETIAAVTEREQAAQKALQDATTAHQAAIDQLNADHETAITAVATERDNYRQQATEQQNTIADLRAQNDALNASQGAAPDAGAAPAADATAVPASPRILSPAETMALANQN